MTERLHLFDTTLRDGQQTMGVDFTVEQKRRIALALDRLGVDHVEGGWPGANPTDTEFFRAAPTLANARMTAFGMTKRAGVSASNDPVLAELLDADTPAVCLVGKTHDFHVTDALGVTLEENLENISESLAHLVQSGREAIFDCEHFFDGYAANPDYALDCVRAAKAAGARWIVLCDTNGGVMPEAARRVVERVADIVGPEHVGIHAHNDTEQAVAVSLAAVEAGARQIQGTLNGLGERCGNANLVSLIPTLMLKAPYASRFETGVPPERLADLAKISRMVDEILNRPADRHAPYVGAAAFAHKAGLHASAIAKDPTLYEHVPPETVGNERVIPISNQAGRSNLLKRLAEAGIALDKDDPRVAALLDHVKAREDRGYAYDVAEASFALLAHRFLGTAPKFFDVEKYRVIVERRFNARNELITASDAFVIVNVGGERRLSAAESVESGLGSDSGPVDALNQALRKDLGQYQEAIEDLRLTDYKVRILTGGTEAVTRVLIESADASGARWSTVGVSSNILEASFQALVDSIVTKLMRAGATPPS